MLNSIEEKKFAELRALCRELGVPPPPEIFIGFKVHDRAGKLIFDNRQRGHSWTRNFYNMQFAFMPGAPGGGSNNFGAGYMSAKRSTGTLDYSTSYSVDKTSSNILNYGIINAATDASKGIVVGTDETAFSAEQYTLGALCAAGNGSGQLAYQAMSAPTIAYTAGTKTWKTTLARIINNNSGGSITVKETGLYGIYAAFSNSASYTQMIERSVLSPTVAVANGAQLTVTYEISMDFSAID